MYFAYRMQMHTIHSLFTDYSLKVSLCAILLEQYDSCVAPWSKGGEELHREPYYKVQFNEIGYCKIIHTF